MESNISDEVGGWSSCSPRTGENTRAGEEPLENAQETSKHSRTGRGWVDCFVGETKIKTEIVSMPQSVAVKPLMVEDAYNRTKKGQTYKNKNAKINDKRRTLESETKRICGRRNEVEYIKSTTMPSCTELNSCSVHRQAKPSQAKQCLVEETRTTRSRGEYSNETCQNGGEHTHRSR